MKKRKLIYFFFLALIAFACDDSVRPSKPDDLIPKEKMVAILKEMFIVNSAKGVNRKLLENRGFDPEEYILKRFDIDSAQFANSNNYYAHDIGDYQSIIENIKTDLRADLDSLREIEDKRKEDAKKRRDSLRQNKVPNPNIKIDSKGVPSTED